MELFITMRAADGDIYAKRLGALRAQAYTRDGRDDFADVASDFQMITRAHFLARA